MSEPIVLYALELPLFSPQMSQFCWLPAPSQG